MFSFLDTLQILVFEIDDLIFGRRKVHYSPAKCMLTLPFIGGALTALFFVIMVFFSNIHQSHVLLMCYCLLGAVVSLNLIFYALHIIMLRNIFAKVGYVIFCVTVSSIAVVVTFVLIALILLLAIVLLALRVLLFSAAEKSPAGGGWVGGGGGGGGGSGGGGSSFVRKDQDCYNLDNGDRVEYSPMTGNYVSTNPLFPTEYAKDGDEFSQL